MYEFPNFNMQDLNLDWILQQIKNMASAIEEQTTNLETSLATQEQNNQEALNLSQYQSQVVASLLAYFPDDSYSIVWEDDRIVSITFLRDLGDDVDNFCDAWLTENASAISTALTNAQAAVTAAGNAVEIAEGAVDVFENMVADEYDSTKTYNPGDYAIVEVPDPPDGITHILYRCIAQTTGSFEIDDWKQVAIANDFEELARKSSAFNVGCTISFTDTLQQAGTVVPNMPYYISAGTSVAINNLSSTATIQISFRNKSNTEITDRITLNAGWGTVITIDEDVYSARIYVNGTDLNVTLNYGENILNTINNMKDVKKLNVNSNDGYYSAQGTFVEQGAHKEKYTDDIKVFTGLKLTFIVEYINSAHSPWNSICEWKKDGTFLRTALNPTNYRKMTYTYTAGSDVDHVSFCYRSYDDCDFSIYVTSNSYDLFKEINSKINTYSYDFNPNAIKGVNHRGYNTVAPEIH